MDEVRSQGEVFSLPFLVCAGVTTLFVDAVSSSFWYKMRFHLRGVKLFRNLRGQTVLCALPVSPFLIISRFTTALPGQKVKHPTELSKPTQGLSD